ncbi:hypothetical protein K431DRAFT_281794 [Polychaeton citri CBS 116435]|uniref:2'-5' RNA ligase superfamily-domain-containing protein n=1 Tax=Polychaeton citri CBS 116435 TaxID=1314669 RepID=A0A9P4QH83_9PEZI|nr:hypothetical protein K431DRAFT_281794 [Polychaeton citri CBS 116435]
MRVPSHAAFRNVSRGPSTSALRTSLCALTGCIPYKPPTTPRRIYSTQTAFPASKKHRANMSDPQQAHFQRGSPQGEEEEVYVLTLLTDAAHQSRMDNLRRAYFPPSRLKVGAHLTLFHALPHSQLSSTIKPLLTQVATDTAAFPITADQLTLTRNHKTIMVYLSGREGGVGQVTSLRERLREGWLGDGFLSDQDRQRSGRPHYTIMNKVPDLEEVARAFEEIRAGWQPDTGNVLGLALWAYNKGFWQLEEEFKFKRE